MFGNTVRFWLGRRKPKLAFSRGWEANPMKPGAEDWTLRIGFLICACVEQNDHTGHFHAHVETRTERSSAEFTDLLVAQLWCEEEIE